MENKENIVSHRFLSSQLKLALKRLDFQRLFFANSMPKPQLMAKVYNVSRIVFPLSGRKELYFSKNQQPTTEFLEPGDIFFSEKSCWSWAKWTYPHKMLSLVYVNNNNVYTKGNHDSSYLRILYIDCKTPSSTPGHKVDYWYHTARGLNHEDIHLLKYLESISNEKHAAERPEALLVIKALLYASCRLLEQDSPPVLSKAQHTYIKIKQYMELNLEQNINRNNLATELQLNPNYVSRLFKEFSGKCFNRYLTELRMERAMELLNSNDLTVAEVAWQCGYSDTSYFIKSFKRFFGETPGCFIRNN